MGNDGYNFFRVVEFERFGGFDQGPAGIRHVVDEDRDFAGDVAHEGHSCYFIRAGPLFVD